MKKLVLLIAFISISFTAQSQYFFRKYYEGFPLPPPYGVPELMVKSAINNNLFSLGRTKGDYENTLYYMITDTNGTI